jgi:pyruvate formate lyase activating enzyme
MITAGYIEQQPLWDLCPYLDAANVDVKGIREDYYWNMTEMHFKPVEAAVKTMRKHGVWLEITNLVVPTANDSDKDIRDLCRWIKETLGPETPFHILKFWPMHRLLNLPPTPTETLTRAWDIARSEGLHYPYVGNVPDHPGNNTYCPTDRKLLIRRLGYRVLENNIIDGKCKFCGIKIPGIWS